MAPRRSQHYNDVLRDHAAGGLSLAVIASRYGMSKATVASIVRRNRDATRQEKVRHRGVGVKLSGEMREVLAERLRLRPSSTLAELEALCSFNGFEVSQSTLHRVVRRLGFKKEGKSYVWQGDEEEDDFFIGDVESLEAQAPVGAKALFPCPAKLSDLRPDTFVDLPPPETLGGQQIALAKVIDLARQARPRNAPYPKRVEEFVGLYVTVEWGGVLPVEHLLECYDQERLEASHSQAERRVWRWRLTCGIERSRVGLRLVYDVGGPKRCKDAFQSLLRALVVAAALAQGYADAFDWKSGLDERALITRAKRASAGKKRWPETFGAKYRRIVRACAVKHRRRHPEDETEVIAREIQAAVERIVSLVNWEGAQPPSSDLRTIKRFLVEQAGESRGAQGADRGSAR